MSGNLQASSSNTSRASLVRAEVRRGRARCGDLAQSLGAEWLVTNGLGGYASGTVAGAATRRYHGTLVAALQPPVGRTVLAGPVDEWAVYAGQRFPLSTHEWAGGAVSPGGYCYIESFQLEGATPVWTYAFAGALLEKRIWMVNGAETTLVRYTLVRASAELVLELRPLLTCRDFHALPSTIDWAPEVTTPEGTAAAIAVAVFQGAQTLHIETDSGAFERSPTWYRNFHYREEAARGFDAEADLYCPGLFRVSLQPDESATLAISTAAGSILAAPGSSEALLKAERERQKQLLDKAGAGDAAPAFQQLLLAADQFVVACPRAASERIVPAATAGKPGVTIIAGYHWFNDWGRDTMIALPGLLLATGRSDEAATTLRTFAAYVRDGLIPNNFPDRAGVDPAYNTADATLWFVLAMRSHAEATGDHTLVGELLPAVRSIVEAHIAGTIHGIGVDPADGLLRAADPGFQLTWMDAKVGDRVITPRSGKPVEVNALWYNVLRVAAQWCAERGDDATASRYNGLASRAKTSFRARFLRAGTAHLADVVDGPAGDDWSLRPNQVFAVSLPEPLLDGDAARDVVESCARSLLTSFGLRSLGPRELAYTGTYEGGPAERDAAYHQGTVWAWLLGPFIDAHLRVYGDAVAARRLLDPFIDHLGEAGLGSISEIFDGDPPHVARGCIAQAWSVAEVLRIWQKLERLEADR